MGNLCSYLRRENKKEYQDHLIRDKFCDKCNVHFISNYEYNRHIVDCKRDVYGDM
jgi:hypothetical protein